MKKIVVGICCMALLAGCSQNKGNQTKAEQSSKVEVADKKEEKEAAYIGLAGFTAKSGKDLFKDEEVLPNEESEDLLFSPLSMNDQVIYGAYYQPESSSVLNLVKYDMEKKNFSIIKSYEEGQFVMGLAVSERYFVYCESANNGEKAIRFWVYDSQKNEHTEMYQGLTGVVGPNTAAIAEDTIFFVESDETDTTLWRYQMTDGSLDKITENAIEPRVLKNKLYYLTSDNEKDSNRLFSLDLETNETKELVNHEAIGRRILSLVVNEQGIYLFTINQAVYKMDPETAELTVELKDFTYSATKGAGNLIIWYIDQKSGIADLEKKEYYEFTESQLIMSEHKICWSEGNPKKPEELTYRYATIENK